MKIEIVTVKLTKSKLNQMHEAHFDAIKNGEVLGFVIGAIKTIRKIILIKYNNDYYILPANYIKSEGRIFRYVGKWTSFKEFENQNECEDWWNEYQKVLKLATKHIYT